MLTKSKVVRLIGILLIVIFPLSGGVFSGKNVAHAQTNVSNPVQVYFNDFDGGTIVLPGVTATLGGVTSLEPVEGYGGYGYEEYFLRNDTGGYDEGGIGTPGSPTTLTLEGLPPHTSIDINFLLAIIDSWDGNAPGEGDGACTDCHPDILTITVDGTLIFSEAFGYNGSVFEPPPGVLLTEPTPLGFNPEFDDAAYDMGVNPTFDDIPHSASTLTIEWFASGDGWQGGLDESWAIDNLEINIDEPPPPTLYAEINFEWVDGWNWPLDSWVTLTIKESEGDEPIYEATSQVGMHEWDDATYVRFDLWEGGFNLEPGHIVTLTDGATTKTHTALKIGITQVNVTDNTVTGFAERDTTLSINAHTPCWETVDVIADGDDYIEEGFAYWQADFDGICELSTVEFVHAEQQGFEEEGVSTGFFWEPPYLGVNIFYDTVSGWSWLPGTEVTLTIDGPDINGTENYTLTKTVGVDTDSTPDTILFDFRGEFYVQPGHIVTLSDGGISIVYEVEYLEVTQVDPDSNIVQGLAEPYDEVLVILGEPWTTKVVFADDEGKWEAGFEDIVPETWGMAQIPTGYENRTITSWKSPTPTTYNINPWWSEVTVRTEDEVSLNVGWGACTPGLVKAFQKDAHIDVTINGEPLYPVGDEALYWGAIGPIELEGCKAAPNGNQASTSSWQYTLSPLEPGIYEVYVHYWLDHPIVDGGDWDGDGKMDKIEGTLIENTITIIVK
jgi:hypothetical protein